MTQAPWDPGLQNERTGLAWQRTMLAGLVCSLLVARLLAEVWLPLAVLVGLAALLGTRGWARSPSAASGVTPPPCPLSTPSGTAGCRP